MISVLIVGDHVVNRTNLAEAVGNSRDLALVGVLASAGLAAVEELQPDVVAVDLCLAGTDGLREAVQIVAVNPDTRLLVSTSHADPKLVVDSLAVGAAGYLVDDGDPEVIAEAIRALVWSARPPDPRVARVLLVRRHVEPSAVQLTGREWQVLDMLGDGRSNKAIAQGLGITVRTVKAHLTRVYQELGVTDRTQAILWALRYGRPGPHALG